ncbi:MAG: DUF354 domain-containing protein, partial [Candidatus Bathyarchaeia archaeon]
DFIVASRAIPRETLQKYNVKEKILQFDGVDEVAWIKGFKPVVKYDFGSPLIVVREVEEKAVYAKKGFSLIQVAKKLTQLGSVVFLSRYRRRTIKGLIIPKEFVDTASLVAQADLFVGAGGTITREAALQGTPALVVDIFQEQYVNDYLADKGFPIFKVDKSSLVKTAKKLLGMKIDTKNLVDKLEDPVDTILKILERLKTPVI